MEPVVGTKCGALKATFEQFGKMCMLAGRVCTAMQNKKARVPAILLTLSFGTSLDAQHNTNYRKKVFTSSAQLCSNHEPQDLTEKLVMSVVNFPRKPIGPNMSDCLVNGAQAPTGSADEKRVSTVYLKPVQPVDPGSLMGVKAEKRKMTEIERNFQWPEFMNIDLRIGEVLSWVFENCEDGLKRIRGTAVIDQRAQMVPFIGLVDREFSLASGDTEKLLFWVNPYPKEVASEYNLPEEDVPDDIVLLCTLDGGRTGIEPAKNVANGFRVA